MTDFSYIAVPFVAWLLAGSSKFLINSIKARRLAFDLIGYGGMPSNHSAIVVSAVALLIMRYGLAHPAVAVATALAFVVMLDANSLRRQIGKQAEVINRLSAGKDVPPLRERMGHTRAEIMAGAVVGVIAAWLTHTASLLL